MIDPILDVLGWASCLRIPHGEEMAVRGRDGLDFIDYLCVDPATRHPKLLVEAKDWKLSGPRPNNRRPDLSRFGPADLLLAGIAHRSSAESATEPPLVSAWMSWLDQVRRYVRNIEHTMELRPNVWL